MPDMLVKLYALPDASALYKSLEEKGIRIIRPMTPNKHKVHEFIVKHFGDGWASEIDTAFTRFPISCFIAYDTNSKEILGFAGYDCTCKAFFGPTGVDETKRGLGIGKALLLRCMERRKLCLRHHRFGGAGGFLQKMHRRRRHRGQRPRHLYRSDLRRKQALWNIN